MNPILLALFAIICGALPWTLLLWIVMHVGKTPGFMANNQAVEDFSNLLASREAVSTGTENPDEPQKPGFADDANRLGANANLNASDHAFSQGTESVLVNTGRLDAATRCSELTDGASLLGGSTPVTLQTRVGSYSEPLPPSSLMS